MNRLEIDDLAAKIIRKYLRNDYGENFKLLTREDCDLFLEVLKGRLYDMAGVKRDPE